MLSSLWPALVLAALGLWASLVPQVTYPSASSGEPVGDVLVAWPGWAVQQDLGPLSGTVGRFQISVSAEPDGDNVTVNASLVDAATREVLRQTSIEATPAYIPVARTLSFPGYVVQEGQRLLLQLQVAEFEHNYVVHRLAVPHASLANLALNGVPDSVGGPLAFAHKWTGSGLRAAINGEQSGRIRFTLAVMCSVVAVLVHPRVSRRLRKTTTRFTHRRMFWARRIAELRTEPQPNNPSGLLIRLLSWPWYPWLFVTIPIMTFMASNQLYFSATEMMWPLVVSLLIVTISFVILRILLKDIYRPTAAIATIGAVFLSYGHIRTAIDGKVDESLLFAGAVVLAAGAVFVFVFVRSIVLAERSAQFANLAALVLVVFPVGSLVIGATKDSAYASSSDPVLVKDLAAHLLPAGLPTTPGHRPDIYYIILDEYGRHDLLGGFDNTRFITELESRGFYVATEATANYMGTIRSLASSLNLAYLHDLDGRSTTTEKEKVSVIKNHALGAILKDLGYAYVHLDSGHPYTDDSQLADLVVKFTPAGVIVSKNDEGRKETVGAISASGAPLLSGYFTREFVQTTALPTIAGNVFRPGAKSDYDSYDWWSPYRTIEMFDVLSKPLNVERPKFVFAHIVKPHTPGTFDAYGNIVEHEWHGNDAYIAQLAYINSLVLKTVDGILQQGDNDTIIVIAGDHGRSANLGPGFSREAILAAFRLPNGGESALYPSISSVNHFRTIMDYYFGAELGLLEDRVVLAE